MVSSPPPSPPPPPPPPPPTRTLLSRIGSFPMRKMQRSKGPATSRDQGFRSSRVSFLPRRYIGIFALVSALSILYLTHITRKLPSNYAPKSDQRPWIPCNPRRTLWPLFSSDFPIPQGHPCEHFVLPPPPDKPGPRPCPVCYLPFEKALAKMPLINASSSSAVKKLSYFVNKGFFWTTFGGQPSWEDRERSFQIQENMKVHCGFTQGVRPGLGSGFDIQEHDLLEMDKCRGIVVASAIFGNYDLLRQPRNINEHSKKSVCFFMFVDEESWNHFDRNEVNGGLWRVVVVRNLPYEDARRNGKIPKLLLHRLFPNARFSLWIDGKLELIVDPHQILERFLWRKNINFAISEHYKRFDVFEEALANKAAKKYDNMSIDTQINFYHQTEGLLSYCQKKQPVFRSDVPEGCVIIKEHTPITNLFTCLWFNEVDRFTSRDQLSFAMVRDKVLEKAPFNFSMFLDCERRNFVVQGYHRHVLNASKSIQTSPRPKPIITLNSKSGRTAPPTGVRTAPTGVRTAPSVPLEGAHDIIPRFESTQVREVKAKDMTVATNIQSKEKEAQGAPETRSVPKSHRRKIRRKQRQREPRVV